MTFALGVYAIPELDGEGLTEEGIDDMLPIALTVTLYIAEDECNVMLYFMEEVAYPLMKKNKW